MVKRKEWFRKKNAMPRRARWIGLYMAEALLLAAVVTGAILTPQLLFRIKDEIVYNSTELGRLESAEMEFLGGAYEKSMHLRMQRFAEGLATGKRFYAASKNLEPTDDLTMYLYSEKGLYQQLMYTLMNLELLYAVFWEYDCRVSQWKQYVVYSDNYGEGISFLLWYIELQCGSGTVMKLLADGETGSVYGVKIEGSQPLTAQDSDMGGYRNPVYSNFFYDDSLCNELLYYLMICYEARSWEELYARLIGKPIQESAYYEENFDGGNTAYLDEEEIEKLTGNAEYVRGDDLLSFQLPYEDNTFLEFRIEIGAVNIDAEYDQKIGFDYVVMYPDITAGIRQLYELIPEFA